MPASLNHGWHDTAIDRIIGQLSTIVRWVAADLRIWQRGDVGCSAIELRLDAHRKWKGSAVALLIGSMMMVIMPADKRESALGRAITGAIRHRIWLCGMGTFPQVLASAEY
jgi:hypothetical protein